MWSDAFAYFKHEESGIGPRLAGQLLQILAEKNQSARQARG
jgi:hypothetical protein